MKHPVCTVKRPPVHTVGFPPRGQYWHRLISIPWMSVISRLSARGKCPHVGVITIEKHRELGGIANNFFNLSNNTILPFSWIRPFRSIQYLYIYGHHLFIPVTFFNPFVYYVGVIDTIRMELPECGCGKPKRNICVITSSEAWITV